LKFQSLFVTGTDTGVGKTAVSCALTAALVARGLRVGVLKPAETGCPQNPQGTRVPQDANLLKFFSGCENDLATICPYPLRDPLAPLVAAHREGTEVDVAVIESAYRRISEAHDVTVVEGAGGLLVPIARGFDYADLAARLALPIVVVVASRLGAINHALLTIRYARSLGLQVVGYVVNFLNPTSDIAADTNVEVLHDLLGPPLGVLPFFGRIEANSETRRNLANEFERTVNVEAFLLPCPS
jgi:dethiobiotin synthetase